ncbi:MAG TPA: carbohydrate-binding family 9-like protein, partial [Bacteroidales bacterium]|nr:carbohydrate-binding family 9-like protein [Bacteroidales bacterium]
MKFLYITKAANRSGRVALLSILFLVTVLFTGFNLSGSPADSVIVKRCNDFTITGSGDNSAWNNTGWIHLIQRSGDTTGYNTRVKILYSGTGIYLLYDCKDKKLTSTMTADNLNLWEEDVVEVFLWPDDSFPVYFEYELSPMNYELPIMVPNYKGNFLGWLPWHYEGERKTRHFTSVTGGKKESGNSV